MTYNTLKNRIAKLIEAVMKVARGDYSIQIELSDKNDELDSLAMGLNMMIDDIRISKEQVDKQIKDLNALNKSLQESLAKVETLNGLLPICAWCKKIRDDKGYWEQVEAYISAHTQAEFTHSISPKLKNKSYCAYVLDKAYPLPSM